MSNPTIYDQATKAMVKMLEVSQMRMACRWASIASPNLSRSYSTLSRYRLI